MRQLAFETAYPQRKTRRRGFVAPLHLKRQSLDPLLSVPAGVNPFRFGAEHAEGQAPRPRYVGLQALAQGCSLRRGCRLSHRVAASDAWGGSL